MRLGGLLLNSKEIRFSRLDEALKAQVIWGGRLGTVLVELGILDLDGLSLALGRLHRLPAALTRHFASAQRAVQQRLTPQLARAHGCIPLWETAEAHVVIAVMDPLSTEDLDVLAGHLQVEPGRVVCAIAPELRIRYQLEAVYGIERPARFLRSTRARETAFPLLAMADLDDDLDDLGDEPLEEGSVTIAFQAPASPVASDADPPPAAPPTFASMGIAELPAPPEEPEDVAQARRRYVPLLGDDVNRARPTISTRRLPANGTATLGDRTPVDVTRAIRQATDRDQVGILVMDALLKYGASTLGGVLFVLRGDVATTWKGFVRGPHDLTELTIGVNQPGLLSGALSRRDTHRAVADALNAVDRHLINELHPRGAELAMLPITVANHVMMVLALALRPNVLSLRDAESITAAAAAALTRLMREVTD